MIRYRSTMTAPGVKPPASIESEEASRPTGEEEGGRRAAAATEGVANPVGIWDREERGSPHEEQKRPESETSAEQCEQRTKSQNATAGLVTPARLHLRKLS